MSNSQRRKGARGENELVGYLRAHGFDAEKISGMYKEGADVTAFNGRVLEVKRRANPVSRQLEGWLEDVSMVVVRADRGEWMCFLRLDELLDLLDEAAGRHG